MTKQQNTINLVRSIMRLSGKIQVWNNKYEKGVRTVKCYRDHDGLKDLNIAAILTQTLGDLHIDHKIKFTEPSGGPWNPGTGGFIVRLPAEG